MLQNAVFFLWSHSLEIEKYERDDVENLYASYNKANIFNNFYFILFSILFAVVSCATML